MAFSSPPCYAFLMQITVKFPDEFAAQVQARGLTPESYVESLIDDAARLAPVALGPIRPKNKMDMETFLRKMAEFSDRIPQLPDEAFTRESFYQDHD
jgi:hypothetical protein